MITVAGCSTGANTGGSGGPKGGPYQFVLSNNFVGNDWRQQMVKTAQVATTKDPFTDKVKLKVVNATDPGVPAQLSDLNNIIASAPDAILIDASSPDALNSAVGRACKAGIVVVSFDQNVTADCAYTVTPTFEDTAYNGAKYVFDRMGGKGTVLVDQGTPGDPNSVTLTNGIQRALKEYPGIKVGGQYASQYGIGQTQSGIASLLASNPQVQGVLALGPNCGAVLTAFQTAGRAAPAVFCTGAGNGALVQCVQTAGAACYDGAFPPYVVALGMRIALDVLSGKKVDKNTPFPPPCIVTDGKNPCIAIAEGVNAFPDKPAGLTFPIAPDWLHLNVDDVSK
jgi:ribose transport system substrate-binding protein